MRKKLVALALVATIVPIFYVIDRVGSIDGWQGVPPQGITDSLLYYARMHEVADGHPLIGNPFIYEYRDSSYAPGSFIPDILSALPLLFGLSFTATIILNLFVWSFLFLFLTTKLLARLDVHVQWVLPITILTYVSAYAFMLRPTIMQVIYPLFIFFLIALISFLHEPLSRKRALILAVASALTFYAYNFLAFIVFFSCVFIFIWFLIRKQFKELRALIMVGLYTTVFLIPFLIFSFHQMDGSLYTETLIRIGMVHTHIPAIEAFFFGRWVVIGLCAFLVLAYALIRKEGQFAVERIFWVATGLSLVTCLFLNVITGVEFTLAIHIGRFVVVWVALLFGVLLHGWYTVYFSKVRQPTMAHVALGFFVMLLALGVAKNLPRATGFFSSDNREATYREVQMYAAPLGWLREHAKEESVIWSNLSIGGYIPILTQHYPLFIDSASSHVVSDEELRERYLLWKSFEHVDLSHMKGDFGKLGAGREKEQPLAFNNRVRFCNILKKIREIQCPAMTDSITFQGKEYFETLVEDFGVVKGAREDLFRKYGVDYFVVDTLRDTTSLPFSTSTAVYNDGRFVIYPMSAFGEQSMFASRTDNR